MPGGRRKSLGSFRRRNRQEEEEEGRQQPADDAGDKGTQSHDPAARVGGGCAPQGRQPAHLKFGCLFRLQPLGDRRATALLLQLSGYGNVFSHVVNMGLNKLRWTVKLLCCL